MLNLRQFERKLDPLRKLNSRYVKIIRMKTGYTDEGLGFVASQAYSTHVLNANGQLIKKETKDVYVTMITFIDNKLNVHISCSCPDNLYRWEVANSLKDAAEVEYSNGEMPDITNPSRLNRTCKHSFRLYQQIKSKLPPGT